MIDDLLKLCDALAALTGITIVIREDISWQPDNGFERHSTIKSSLTFKVEHVDWQMSGGHLWLHGEDAISGYQINAGKIKSFDIRETDIVVIELYNGQVARRSTIEKREAAA